MTLEQQADELLKDHQIFHDSFQIQHFIVGKAGNVFGRHRQCLREIDVRRRRQREVDREIRRAKLKVARLGTPRTTEEFIDKEEIDERIADMEATLAGIERELGLFVALAADLKRKLGELDDEVRYALEAEHWVSMLCLRVRVEMLSQGRITAETMTTLAALPDDLKAKVLEPLRKVRGEINDFDRKLFEDVFPMMIEEG